jgi:hypothetical protein
MTKHYSDTFLRTVRNKIPINNVITHLLKMETRYLNKLFRFRCPLCGNYHTAIKKKTNLARCFDCKKNYNSIDLVIIVANCNFVDAVERLKKVLK